MKAPPELDAMADKVLDYNPDAPKGPLKVIAGASDRPLVIGDIKIPCYVLSDETRVLVQRGMAGAMGMSADSGARIARFTSSKVIKPHISNELKVVIDNPVKFPTPGGIAHGYPATLLAELCNAVLSAREAGTLQHQQLHIARQCEVLIRGLASVGIIALVDEATGYQRIRAERALATILEKFIAKDLQPWKKTFPYEFYEQIFRLKGWAGPNGVKRPSVIGKYTNDIVYARVAPGVLDELRRLNPSVPGGSRKWRHHQWFTPEPGYIKLNQHLAAVIALMKVSSNWGQLQRHLKYAFPQLRDQLDSDFGDGQ